MPTAFAMPGLYESVEEREAKYDIRLPANGQPGAQGCAVFKPPGGKAQLEAGGALQELSLPGSELDQGTAGGGEGGVPLRGIVPAGRIYRDHIFQTSSRAVVRFYNKRGTAEQWIKEGKQAVAMTRLSCHRFRANEVRLWLSVIAYNLRNLWRRAGAAGSGSPTGRSPACSSGW